MQLEEEVLRKQLKAVLVGRGRILQSMETLLQSLESETKSERAALEFFNQSLKQSGFSQGWYGAGSRSGYSDVFRGSIVVFDDPDDPDRINFLSARDILPSFQVQWSGLAFLYASPIVHFEHDGQVYFTGADLAMTVYVGKNDGIRDHFKRRALLQLDLLRMASRHDVVVTSEIYEGYLMLAREYGLSNIAISQTTIDKGFGITNIGHSLPAIGLDDRGEGRASRDIYSNERRFVGATDDRLAGSLWTMESRDIGRSCSIGVSFHDVICRTEDAVEPFPVPYVMEVGERLGMEWIREV